MTLPSSRPIVAWVVASLVAVLLVPLPRATPAADAADPDWIITLDGDGPSTDHTRMPQGIEMRWHNRSGRDLTVTSPDGALDSGPIPDGGSFRAELGHAGHYTWETEVGGGTVQIYWDFDGDTQRPVAGEIPDLAFPPRPQGDITSHPDLTVAASRTRALVTFTEDATVDDAQDALSDAGTDIIGGLPATGVVLVSVSRDPGDFRLIDRAVERLRADPAIAAAVHEVVPSDASLPAPTRTTFSERWGWHWDPLSTEPAGTGGNWTHEISRVPAAWNLSESVTNRGGTRPATVVVDAGFEAHEDLSRLSILELCQSRLTSASLTLDVAKRCTSLAPSDHGNHVAGIVGADHDERRPDSTSIGVPGTDTLSRLYGLSRKMPGGLEVLSDDEDSGGFVAYELLLRELQAGRLTDVRVINHSTTLMDYDREAWGDAHGSDTCGPGVDDDGAGGGTCFPDTHDPSIEEMVNHGRIMRDVVEAYVNGLEDPPLFVVAAGNDGATFCPGLTLECDTPRPLPTTAASTMSWSSRNWVDPAPNPILIVESIGRLVDGRVTPGTQRSGFSNLGGDIAAPGLAVSTGSAEADSCPDGSNSYCYQQGTSQAAPQVAGIAGMLANWDPSLSATQLKQRLLDWARADTSDGASERVDAYLPLLSLPGAARAAVDVNDPSADGNRRVIYGPEGTTTLDQTLSSVAGHATDPDGVVDMRDFRRFRDAWLAGCLLDASTGCPDSIDLDGPADHPKRDLNQDGCHGLHAPSSGQLCPSEATWSRFDFNGDGVVTRDRPTLVGLTADGAPAPGPGDAVQMTDLEVLASQWDGEAPGAQGVAAADLEGLLESGELILHGDGLEAIADEVAIVIDAADDGEQLFEGVFTPGGDPGIATLPADRAMALSVIADGPSQRLELDLHQPALLAGEDRRVDLCGGLSLEVAPGSLRPDGGSADVTARISSCGQDVSGLTVDLAVDPVATDGATLADAGPVTDQDGVATTTIDAGTATDDYTVTAAVDVPLAPGVVVTRTAEARLRVSQAYTYEVVADDASGSGYAWLRDPCAGASKSDGCLLGPAVNAAGDVAFRAELANRSGPSVVVAGDGVDPTNPSTALDLTADQLPSGSLIEDGPRINDDGEVVIATSLAESLSRQRSWIHRLFTAVPGTVTEIAAGSTDDADGEPFERVECPDTPALGEVAFAADLADGSRVVTRPDGDGFRSGLGTAQACPDLARDGTTATSSLRATGETDDRGFPVYEGLVLVGDDVQQQRVAIAAAGEDGWTSVGGPALADTGEAVVFTGDRGDGGGVWLAVRDGSGLGDWQEPQLVAGANDNGGRPELGTASDGSDRYFTDVADHGSGDLVRYGSSGGLATVHVPRAPAGIAGDRILVALLGTPNGAGDDFTDQPGLWTVAIDVVDDGGTLAYDVGRPVPAVQHGQTLAGGVVEELAVRDALAVPDDGTSVDDHWLAFAAESDPAGTDDNRSVIVRARWQGTPSDSGSGVTAASVGTVAAAPRPAPDTTEPATTETTDDTDTTGTTDTTGADGADDGLSVQTLAAVTAEASPEFETFDAPHIAAITITDDEPVQGVPFTVVNRSRTLDGRAAWAVLDANMASSSLNKYDGGLPVLLEPDGSTEVVNPEDDGNWPLVLSAPVVADGQVSQLQFKIDVQRPPNRPAVVDLGGPYTIAHGQDLAIDYDVDDDAYWSRHGNVELDLDGDGVHDDGSQGVNRSSIDISAERVRQDICGGTCDEDVPYTIGVAVTDSDGAVTTATTTVTVSGTQDFTLDVQPETLDVNPGDSGRAYAMIRSVDGFEGEVDIEVEGAPDDWSVSTDRADDAPTDLRITVRVPNDAPNRLFDLDVTARSGEIEHTDTFTVSTVFGLISRCEVDVSVQVTDAATGDPVERARITSLWPLRYTDEDGRYDFTYTLPEGFRAFEYTLSLDRRPTYRDAREKQVFTCDQSEASFDVALEPVPTAGAEGVVVVGRPNPWDPDDPAPTGTPIEGATVRISAAGTTYDVTDTDAQGRFGSPDSVLVPGDTTTVTARADADGYWPNAAYAEVAPGQHVDVGAVALVEQCHGTLGGGRVVDQHGEPIAGSRVTAEGGGDVTTDEDGRFWFGTEGLLLDHNNRPRSYRVTARAPDDWDARVNAQAWAVLRSCDDVSDDVTLALTRPAPPPEENYANLDVQVVDAATGDPLPDAWVDGDPVDDDGRISFTDLFVGYDDDTTRDDKVRAEANGYYRRYASVTLEAGQTVETTIELIAREYGRMEGRVLDSVTGEPVEGALVRINGDGFSAFRRYGTDKEGRYVFDDLELLEPNQVSDYDMYAEKQDPDTGHYVYWPGRIDDITVEPGETTVQDIELLPVCEGGTIRGTVVDASTLDPLEDVTIQVSGDGRTWHTDEDGEFELPNIRPDTNNEPNDVRVTASKSGYFSAGRDITIFCGADIRLDFGTPDAGFGTVVGTVTDTNGDPLEGVFIGSGYGGAAKTDADGNYILDDAPVAPNGSPRDWDITAQGDLGKASATVTVTKDEEVRQDFVLGADNDPPTAEDQAIDTVAGAAVPVGLTGQDPDGDPISYTVLSQPTDGTLDGAGALWTYTPDEGFVGEDSFTFATQDAAATSAPATVTVTVAPAPNQPPSLVVPGDLSIMAGESLTLRIAADDPDGDEVTLGGDGLPGWAGLTDGGDGTGTIEIDTHADHAGSSAELTVVASDGTEEVREGFTVDVTAPPDPNGAPTARLAVDRPVPEGSPIVLDARGSSDPDGDSLAYVWSIGGEPHEGAVVEVPTVDDGMHPVVLRVEDGAGGTHRIERMVRVANVAPAVVVEHLDPRGTDDLQAQTTPGQSLEVVARVSDPGTIDDHTARIDWGDGTSDAAVVQDGRLRARHAYDTAGERSVVIDVCDDDDGCGRATLEVVVAGASDVGNRRVDGAPAGPGGVSEHPRTGIPATQLLLIALLSICLGAPLTRWRPRRAHRD